MTNAERQRRLKAMKAKVQAEQKQVDRLTALVANEKDEKKRAAIREQLAQKTERLAGAQRRLANFEAKG